jgi:hypothetical protein
MKRVLAAVFEKGSLRPVVPLEGLVEGQQVWVTVREMVQEPDEQGRREAEMLRRMEAEGSLETASVPVEGSPPTDFQPLVLQGEPLSETVIRMRGERG